MPKPVKVTFLGGLGEIGRNCACVEVDGKIMLIDCGIMFPDIDMPGIDLVLPDFAAKNPIRPSGIGEDNGNHQPCADQHEQLASIGGSGVPNAHPRRDDVGPDRNTKTDKAKSEQGERPEKGLGVSLAGQAAIKQDRYDHRRQRLRRGGAGVAAVGDVVAESTGAAGG